MVKYMHDRDLIHLSIYIAAWNKRQDTLYRLYTLFLYTLTGPVVLVTVYLSILVLLGVKQIC